MTEKVFDRKKWITTKIKKNCDSGNEIKLWSDEKKYTVVKVLKRHVEDKENPK